MSAPRQVSGLAERLEALRRSHWPDQRVKRKMLAAALGVVPSSVSAWEKGVLPPKSRLDDYALFFATRRSLAGSRLPSVDDLTDDEEAARQELAAELRELRRVAVGDNQRAQMDQGHFSFPDGAPVRLICGHITKSVLRRSDSGAEYEQTETPRSKYASGRERNYMALMAYADLDSLVELFGHIRASNPRTIVGFDLDARLESDDLTGHLVVGGMGEFTGAGGTILEDVGAPIRQVPDPEMPDWGDEGEIFEVEGDPAVFRRPIFAGSRLIEDVGLFMRAPNPYNAQTTVTFVSGVFTRGGYGAVRMLTDAVFRERNEEFLATRFAGATKYAVLVRVRVHGYATVTPNLTAPGVLLHGWPLE